MDRRSTGFLLILAIASLVTLSGCVGNGTPAPEEGGVQSVTLSPSSNVSLELGGVRVFTATARNSAGQTVFTTIQFTSDNNAALTIATNGVACAGTWDSLTNPVFCRPGVSGIAKVTATADGVSSPAATVFVHQHIQSIQVTPVDVPTDPCFSQGKTWNFKATAYSANSVDITNTIGPLTWSSSPSSVLTVNNVDDLLDNQVQVTAANPGISQLFASASGATSTPIRFTTCLVSSIMLQLQNGTGNSTSIAAGSTKALEATVLDTLGKTLTKPPLTWSTSNPEIATVSTAGVITARQTPGFANISASCSPPSCNIGVLPGLPVYSTGGTPANGRPAFGVITAHVTNATRPAASAWAATTDCNDAFGCTSVMFPVVAGTTPIGTGVTLPYTPNSMLFNPAGTRAYLGSTKGLMFVDVTQNTVSTVSSATTPCNVAVCGKPIAISADGNLVVVADTDTVPNQVYIFNAGNTSNAPVNLLIDGATAAAFSPDQLKLFILGNTGKLYVYSTVDSLLSVPVSASSTGLAFSADGSFAYVAGTPGSNVSAFSTCTIPPDGSVNLGNVSADSTPLKVFPLPDIQETLIDPVHSQLTQNLIALEQGSAVGSASALQVLTTRFTRNPIENPAQLTCNVPTLTFESGELFNLGQGDFTPLYTQVTGDGSRVIVVAKNIPAVLVFDLASGTTTSFPLADGALPLAATTSLDGTQIFVAGCQTLATDDQDHQRCTSGASVHIVTVPGGDIQQAIYTNVNTADSMCAGLDADHPCTPNLIAVRPQ